MNNKGQQMRISEQEISLLKNTFGKNDTLLKLLRKVFLPELDPDLPIGQMIDLWMTVDIKDKDPIEAKIQMMARNSVIMHVENSLIQLKTLVNQGEETPEMIKARLKKDSSK